MKPAPDLILSQAFAKITMEMGQALPAGYEQASARTLGVLLLMVAQEFNRAAEIRAKENAAMRSLFEAAAASAGDDLARRLRAAAREQDGDLNVAALDRANAALKGLLIELHAHAEERGDRGLETRILDLLGAAAAARQVFLPAM